MTHKATVIQKLIKKLEDFFWEAGSEAVNWSEVNSPTPEDWTGCCVCLLSKKADMEDGFLTADLGDLLHPLHGRGYGKLYKKNTPQEQT